MAVIPNFYRPAVTGPTTVPVSFTNPLAKLSGWIQIVNPSEWTFAISASQNFDVRATKYCYGGTTSFLYIDELDYATQLWWLIPGGTFVSSNRVYGDLLGFYSQVFLTGYDMGTPPPATVDYMIINPVWNRSFQLNNFENAYTYGPSLIGTNSYVSHAVALTNNLNIFFLNKTFPGGYVNMLNMNVAGKNAGVGANQMVGLIYDTNRNLLWASNLVNMTGGGGAINLQETFRFVVNLFIAKQGPLYVGFWRDSNDEYTLNTIVGSDLYAYWSFNRAAGNYNFPAGAATGLGTIPWNLIIQNKIFEPTPLGPP